MIVPSTPAGAQTPSWRKAALRWVGPSLAAAFVLQAALWLMDWMDWIPRSHHNWVSDLYWPAFALTILLSGNPHLPSYTVAFLAQVLETFLMIFALVVGIVTARYLALRRRRSRA
jgi:hypothetical protein